MKKLMTVLALALLSTAAFAIQMPEYYVPDFKILEVSPMCPSTIPSGAVCMALGSIVKVETTLSCGDKLVFSEFKTQGTTIFAVALAKRHPDSDRIRCFRANRIRKTVTIGSIGRVELINVPVESY